MSKNIKVLQIIANPDVSLNGVEKIILSYYEYMPVNIIFDFALVRKNSMESIQNKGKLKNSRIFVLDALNTGKNSLTNYIILYKRLANILKSENYDILHVNSGLFTQPICYICARRHGIKYYFAHSHSAERNLQNGVLSSIKKMLFLMCQKYIVNRADCLLGCSRLAGEKMFGVAGVKSNKYKQINNAINAEKYLYSLSVRNSTRKKYKLDESQIVFGHVGRMTKEKNHEFIIELFKEVQISIPDSVLWLIGDGSLRTELEKKVMDYGLENKVVFWGARSDVDELLQAIDIFIFPSLYEGLSLVMVEAQASGLQIVASDSISVEHKITSLVHFLPLQIGVEGWKNEIIQTIIPQLKNRENEFDVIKSAGYDIKTEAAKLEKLYKSVI